MTDTAYDQTDQPVEQPEPDAPQPEERPPEQPPEPPPPGAETQQAEEWARQFPGGASDIYRALQETKGTLTREQQQRAEYERQLQEFQQAQQPPDPWGQLPPQIDEFQQQQIAAYAQRDPAAAAKWAYENYHELGPEVAGQLFQYWQQRDYWGAEAWKAEQLHAQWREETRQQVMGEVQPIQDQITNEKAALAVESIRGQIPNFDAWLPQIVDFLQAPGNEQWLETTDVRKVGVDVASARLFQVYLILHGQQEYSRRGGQPQQAAAPQPGSQTETSSTADGGQPREANGRFIEDPGRRQGRLARIEGLD